MSKLVLILDNLRSSHNVGSILRTCDGFAIKEVYAVGITPYPRLPNDTRLEHIAKKAHNQIGKTALGAENTVLVRHFETVIEVASKLKHEGFSIWALEQSEESEPLTQAKTTANEKIALVLGNEVNGVDLKAYDFDKVVEIKMSGKKESFNVSIAAAIAIYQLS